MIDDFVNGTNFVNKSVLGQKELMDAALLTSALKTRTKPEQKTTISQDIIADFKTTFLGQNEA